MQDMVIMCVVFWIHIYIWNNSTCTADFFKETELLMCMNLHVGACVFIHVCLSVRACVCMCICACMHVCERESARSLMCKCVCVRVCVRA